MKVFPDRIWVDAFHYGWEYPVEGRAMYTRTDAGSDDWVPIENIPPEWEDGRMLLFYAPAYDGLPSLQGAVCYHPDAGWCVDELRVVTHLRPLLPSPEGRGS